MVNTEKRGMKAQIVVKMPLKLRGLIERYIALNAHKDISEFVRDACREKIQRDAPGLYRGLFTEG